MQADDLSDVLPLLKGGQDGQRTQSNTGCACRCELPDNDDLSIQGQTSVPATASFLDGPRRRARLSRSGSAGTLDLPALAATSAPSG